MGYIMPVENYQYQQYQQRVTKVKRDPFPIEKVYPIQHDTSYEESQTRKEEVLPSSTQRSHYRLVINQQPESKPKAHIYAQVTGKGRHFQAKV
ncbi:hypothetical protein MUN88_12705 [Gracilibacillus caseinilyticus]|uniref:Uncharacterized protein n=1 Tax=Gracilibacillus caseinilyticus TaxID=2932256 RepID=A0ABY4ESB0_9BACI|nr:hypothetical protein [Gracilibacillus caseinilyticus]UOQ46951.1 hypothetical protein MUN88_12705 [Gracilibacillus caseinilyticus]